VPCHASGDNVIKLLWPTVLDLPAAGRAQSVGAIQVSMAVRGVQLAALGMSAHANQAVLPATHPATFISLPSSSQSPVIQSVSRHPVSIVLDTAMCCTTVVPISPYLHLLMSEVQ
jgi:hypothetical protein